MIHKTKLEHYESWEEIAEEIGNLRYDALADFLQALSHKIQQGGQKDGARGRVKLERELLTVAKQLEGAATASTSAWVTCKPFM